MSPLDPAREAPRFLYNKGLEPLRMAENKAFGQIILKEPKPA